jgi:hypothetical protein
LLADRKQQNNYPDDDEEERESPDNAYGWSVAGDGDFNKPVALLAS